MLGGLCMNCSIAASCMQLGAKSVACLTPCHATAGCGFFQRRSPVGGAANGIPLNDAMPLFVFAPSAAPPVTLTVVIWAAAENARAQATAAAAAAWLARRSQWFIVLA